jgi:cytosine/adenosine deaminase-related metal-dependent hydrolase
VVHLNELAETDFDSLAKLPEKFSIVHCPRSHEYFGHSSFQFEKLRDAGFNICLGTDSLASYNDLSPFGEMRAFQKEFPSVAPEEILEMVTLNPARALQQEAKLGKIRAGFAADFITIPSGKSNSIFEEIVAFDRPVDWAMLGGQISV